MSLVRAFCLVLAFAATTLSAQLSVTTRPLPLQQPPAHPSSVTFRIMVTDRAGHPVTGLAQSAFTVLDNGKPVAVQSFAAHTLSTERVSAVIVIDAVNIGFVGTSLAIQQTKQFLRNQSEPLPFPVGIVLLTDTGLTSLGPGSSDGKLLLTQLDKQGGHLRAIERSGGFWGAEERTEISLNALTRLSNFLAAQPGRKLIFWISPGWPVLDNPNVELSTREEHVLFAGAVGFSNELREGNIALFDIDPLGTWDAVSFRTTAWKTFTKPVRSWGRALPGNLALQVLAVQSGGIVLSGSNDVAGEVKTCAQDASSWYSIRFAPQRSEKPNTWHSVKIQVNQPGLTVRTNPGYYAQP